MNKNMIARIAVAAVAIPAILWICYQGGWWLKGMVSLFAIIGLSEFLFHENIKPNKALFSISYVVLFFLLLITLFIDLFGSKNTEFSTGVVVGILLILGMVIATGKDDPKELFERYTRLLFGLFYIGLLYPYVYFVGQGVTFYNIEGGHWLLFLFAILWVGDSAALFLGKAIGKNKLAPSVSPNKTVEGFFGGVTGAILVGIVMSYTLFDQVPIRHLLLISVGCSIFGQLGDLVESMWKRSLNIKDSSNIIPGHGGVLDRFDSLLFAAPFMYFYMHRIFLF
ncbi:MAG: hypothetical protein DWP97_07355 [Calditrichaeota bacterium]|nr:MAG: hypothetical protein DWP97_07355 [Calditrichota bacterium]